MKREIFFTFFDNLFNFFNNNLTAESYEMNFTACEFYLFAIEEENGELLKDERTYNEIKSNLKK